MQFNQPDTVIPEPYNTLDWNRYAYARYNPLIYTDPTGHDPVLDFFGGLLKELARTNFWWHPGYQRDLAIKNNESTAELTGRLVADVASIAVGAAEGGGGAGIAGGGVAACGTGVGCLVTPEALVAGGALIAQGTGTVISASEGAAATLAAFSANFSSSKKERQAQNRGWTDDLIENLIKDPAKTATSVNKATGNSATVYYDADGNYVVVDDKTGEIFHVSDRNDPNWYDPFGKQRKK